MDGGLVCVNVGYGREELAKVAYEQLKQLLTNSFFQCTHPPVIELSEKFCKSALSVQSCLL